MTEYLQIGLDMEQTQFLAVILRNLIEAYDTYGRVSPSEEMAEDMAERRKIAGSIIQVMVDAAVLDGKINITDLPVPDD